MQHFLIKAESMYKFSRRSKAILSQVDPKLQDLFNEVIKHVDISITSGVRSATEQRELYKKKLTTLDGVDDSARFYFDEHDY